MVARGNKDSYRYGYTTGVKADNAGIWGRETARERYGALDFEKKAPPPPEDRSEPQRLGDRNNLRGPGWQDDTANDWRRAANEDATRKPNFDSRGKDGKPDKW
jgi:hypothetical protein